MHNSQEVANVIKALAKERNISIGKMLAELGLSINTMSSMQSGGFYPRVESLTKIADYLGVSVDYLLGRDLSLPHEDARLISLMKTLTAEEKSALENFINYLIKKRK
jgi:transcriptional regulator with XRE-family HTH domain